MRSESPVEEVEKGFFQGHHEDSDDHDEGPENAGPERHVAEPSDLVRVEYISSKLKCHEQV